MPAKRVLHILPHRGGGGAIYVSMLAAAPGWSHESFYLSAGRTPGSAVLSLPIRLPRLLWTVLDADIVHVHGDAAALICSPLLGARPSVLTTHGLHLLRRTTGATRQVVKLGLRGAIAASRAVIATSRSEFDELAPVARLADRNKLRVILNSVPPATPITEDEREQTRAELGITPNTVLGVFAGALEPRKEPLLAAAAATKVHEAGVPFVLVIAGDGPLAVDVAASSSAAIRPLGHRLDLPRLLAAADLFVQPSSREGMSLALLEAMSHGLAVIAADAPGNAEAVADTGFIFPAGDTAALADAITQVVTNRELRIRLGDGAAQRASQHYGVDRFLAATAAVYSAALVSESSTK